MPFIIGIDDFYKVNNFINSNVCTEVENIDICGCLFNLEIIFKFEKGCDFKEMEFISNIKLLYC